MHVRILHLDWVCTDLYSGVAVILASVNAPLADHVRNIGSDLYNYSNCLRQSLLRQPRNSADSPPDM